MDGVQPGLCTGHGGFALEHAREQQDEELARLARRLQDSWSGDKPRHAASAETAQSDSSVTTKAAEILRTSARYIGGLR